MTQWNPTQSRWTVGSGTSRSKLTFTWDSTHDGGQRRHMMQLQPGTHSEGLDERELLTRVICHVLVDRIPRRGLIELAESLGGMYSYYEDEDSRAAQLPPATVTRGRTVRAETRSIPQFEEE